MYQCSYKDFIVFNTQFFDYLQREQEIMLPKIEKEVDL